MYKYITIALFISSLSVADCVPSWLEDQNKCRLYTPCSSEGEKIEWNGDCENNKINGSGILKWYVNNELYSIGFNTITDGKINPNKFQIDIWDENIFLGYEGNKGFLEGIYIEQKSNKLIYIGSFKETNIFNKGILIDENLNIITGTFNTVDDVSKLKGEGFTLNLLSSTSEHGIFHDGEIKESIRTRFHNTKEPNLCNFVVSLRSDKTLKYPTYYKGLCGLHHLTLYLCKHKDYLYLVFVLSVLYHKHLCIYILVLCFGFGLLSLVLNLDGLFGRSSSHYLFLCLVEYLLTHRV